MKEEETTVHEGKVFNKVTFTEKDVVGREFIDCTFSNCVLTKLNFVNCSFNNCSFDSCDLSLIKVKGCSFSKVSIMRSKAMGIHWFDARTPFGVNFTETNISYCIFLGMNLKKVKIIRCNATECDFAECGLTEVSFEGSELLNARFGDCDLAFASFRGALNYNINLKANKVKKTIFTLPEANSLLNSFDIILE